MSIPDSAMLQPADVQEQPGYPASGIAPYLQPPRPCADTRYPSDELRIDSRSLTFIYSRSYQRTDSGLPESRLSPGIDANRSQLVEYVALYRPGGAQQFLAEFRAAMAPSMLPTSAQATTGYAQCPQGSGTGGRRWAFMGPVNPGYSRDRLWVDVTSENRPGAATRTNITTVGVERVGNAVVVVANLGSEYADGDIKLVANIHGAASHRVEKAFS